MKILATQAAILTNHEVLQHLNSVQARYASHPDYLPAEKRRDERTGKDTTVRARLTTFRDVVDDVHRYLTAGGALAKEGATYNEASFRGLMQRLARFQLTKPELVNVINIRPRDSLTLDVCIEEMEQRFSDDDQAEMLKVITEELGAEPGNGAAVDGEGADGGTEEMDVDRK